MGAGEQHQGVARLKVLALVTRLPVPPWRGDQVRAFHHLRLLARRHEITLCALLLRRPRAADVAGTRALGLALEVVELGLASAGPALARALVDPCPLQGLLFRRRHALAHVRRLVARGRFDVVHAQLVRTGAYWLDAPGPPVVLDLVDALSTNFARRAARDRGPWRWISALEGERLWRYERRLVAAAAATLVVSEPDRVALGDRGVRVVPNGVDVMAFPFSTAPRQPGRIVFAGNLGYFPNVDAARWLVEAILPAVQTRVPKATVHLVGARPAPVLRALARAGRLTLAADVREMAPEVASAAISVIGMRSGSGMQNKVLEAMAVGTPVVTTPQVAAALAIRDGEHALLGTTAAELAGAATALLLDPERGRRMARAARELVEHVYGWETSAGAVEAAWVAATAANRTR